MAPVVLITSFAWRDRCKFDLLSCNRISAMRIVLVAAHRDLSASHSLRDRALRQKPRGLQIRPRAFSHRTCHRNLSQLHRLGRRFALCVRRFKSVHCSVRKRIRVRYNTAHVLHVAPRPHGDRMDRA